MNPNSKTTPRTRATVSSVLTTILVATELVKEALMCIDYQMF